MLVIFVNPPNLAHCDADLAPPLWALLLGAVASDEGVDSRLLDLNLEVLDDPKLGEGGLYDWAVALILQDAPDFVCFSSMAVNSHVGLEIARRLKKSSPEIRTIFGGPHFGAVARSLLDRYPWVDVVVQGEAEVSFRALLRQFKADRKVGPPIAGVFIRRPETQMLSSSSAQVVEPSDVPPPRYELADMKRYFRLNPRRVLDFDGAARGCIFACRYCYAPQHFGQGSRMPPAERFVRELARAAETGAKHFFIVQDNLVNRPADSIELCKAISAANLGITFHCYATLAQLTEEVTENLAAAGCRAVYVGVDAVHADAKRDFAKAIFRSETDLLQRAAILRRCNIEPTLAFLLREPEIARDEIEITVAVALSARMHGCSIRFNTLTLYPGTPAYSSHTGGFTRDEHSVRLILDLPECVYENSYSADAPELFPFHSTHREPTCQAKFQLGTHCLFSLAVALPEEILKVARRGRVWELVERIVADQDIARESRRPVADRRREHIERFVQQVRRARFAQSTASDVATAAATVSIPASINSQVP